MATERGYIKIKPFDGLFFGKGRPFQMGDDTWTEAELLPPPGVVWGALASQLYYLNGHQAIDPKNFKIGPTMLLGKGDIFGSLHIPAPLDIFITKEDKKHHHTFTWQREDNSNLTKMPLFIHHRDSNVLIEPHNEDVDSPENRFISLANFFEHYSSEISTVKFDFDLGSSEDWVNAEYKIGIARQEDTRTAEDSKLFTVQLSHLNPDSSFVVEFSNDSDTPFPEQGILKLGGEGKMAAFNKIDKDSALGNSLSLVFSPPLGNTSSYRFFKAVALMPLTLDEHGLPLLLKHGDYEILGGVTGKPVCIGGFDLHNRRPKPLQKQAPAGSIWILGAKNDPKMLQTVIEELKNNHEEKGRINPLQLFPYHKIAK